MKTARMSEECEAGVIGECGYGREVALIFDVL